MQCDSTGCHPVRAHKTGDMAIDAGVGVEKAWLDLPDDNVSPMMAELHAGMGVYASPVLAIGLRGHVVVGGGPTTITSLGIDVQLDRGGIFVAACPAIASLHVASAIPELGAADALAAAVELRAGLDLGRASVAIVATPMYAFANDSVDPSNQLHGALRLGASVAIELP